MFSLLDLWPHRSQCTWRKARARRLWPPWRTRLNFTVWWPNSCVRTSLGRTPSSSPGRPSPVSAFSLNSTNKVLKHLHVLLFSRRKVSQWPIMTNVFRLCCHYKIMFCSWVTKKVTAKKKKKLTMSHWAQLAFFPPSVSIVFSTYCSFTDDADKNGGRKKIIVLSTENPQQSDARLFLLRSSFQDKEE